MRISEDKIEKLSPDQVFVFGSNEAGIHGAGAALIAFKDFGANWDQGFGFHSCMFGKTFAIPTKDWDVQVLPLPVIQFYVSRFLDFTKTKPNLNFLVTQIGCGLAGYKVEEIAPLFKKALVLENVYLPKAFIDYLQHNGPKSGTVY